jgi:stage V sporulation protein SpoVS
MSKRAAIGQAVATAGVIVSLAMVAYEIRANTNAVVSQTIQALAEQQGELALSGIDNPDLRDAFTLASREGVDALTDEQITILNWFYTAVMRVTENRFRQFQLGTLSEEALIQLGAKGALFRNPFFAAYWPTQVGMHSPDFEAFIERELLPLGDAPPLPRTR